MFLVRFVLFTFQESPKYSLGKGEDEEALKLLDKWRRRIEELLV